MQCEVKAVIAICKGCVHLQFRGNNAKQGKAFLFVHDKLLLITKKHVEYKRSNVKTVQVMCKTDLLCLLL